MSLRHVVIVSPYGLFREGLKRLLTGVAQVELATSLQEVEMLARKRKVDAVVIDQADDRITDSEAIARLLALPDTRVITVSLAVDDMQIYRHEQVGKVSAEDLVAAILG